MMNADQDKDNKSVGELVSLRQLVEKYGEIPTSIVIPKIQRDYAQGRPGKEKLRENFLEDLFSVIKNDDASPRVYDYIYGQVSRPFTEGSENYRFYPVDGQQRLTTMFLLHLYIGKRAGENIDFLKQFSYQTRISSKLFCEMLCDIDSIEFNHITEFIKDDHRFTSHWKSDPTISSMLSVLDDIERFINRESAPDFKRYWKNLTEKVLFWMLDLKGLDTTDEIYIKMNSRGKGLTDFENFKAELDNLVHRYDPSFVEGEYAMKIDTDWTRIFWAYRDPDLDFVVPDPKNPQAPDYTSNGLDDKMLNFFQNMLVLEGIKNETLATSKLVAVSDPAQTNSKVEYLSNIELAEIVAKASPDVFKKIADLLDFFTRHKSEAGRMTQWFEQFLTSIPDEEADYGAEEVKILPPSSKIDIFEVFMGAGITLHQMLFAEGIFHTIMQHPELTEIHGLDSVFDERLRILRNLILNSEIHDSFGDMRRNLISVDNLMVGGLDAIMNASDEFSGIQKTQEKFKIDWMKTAPIQQAVTLRQIENHSVLRGNLWMLYCKSPLSMTKFRNFRTLFTAKADYDELQLIALTYGDYAVFEKNNPAAKCYFSQTPAEWRNKIFINNDPRSALDRVNLEEVFDKMLGAESIFSFEDYRKRIDARITHCEIANRYDWLYYLSRYASMRWSSKARKGWYLRGGDRYLYYMFRASTCYHTDSYIHYNAYNDALCSQFCGEYLLQESDRGGALTIGSIGVKFDVLEDSIRIILNDDNEYNIPVPQNDGVDSTDRIVFASTIIKQLLELSDNGDKILSSADFESIDYPRWVKLEKSSEENTDNA